MKVERLKEILQQCPSNADIVNECDDEGPGAEVHSVVVFKDLVILSNDAHECRWIDSVAFYTEKRGAHSDFKVSKGAEQ